VQPDVILVLAQRRTFEVLDFAFLDPQIRSLGDRNARTLRRMGSLLDRD